MATIELVYLISFVSFLIGLVLGVVINDTWPRRHIPPVAPRFRGWGTGGDNPPSGGSAVVPVPKTVVVPAPEKTITIVITSDK